jgi:hypothetical protein
MLNDNGIGAKVVEVGVVPGPAGGAWTLTRLATVSELM